MKRTILLLGIGVLGLLNSTLKAQIPQIINYQGRVVVGTTNFNGNGQFKFALVNANGTTTYWSNDGTSVNGSQPTAAVSLTVTSGLYSVLLGDTTIANMSVAIPTSAFTNTDVRLRVWFNDGVSGSQQLSPDQRIASVGYANMAGNILDGAITSAKIASGAVGSTQIASSAVTTAKIANGAVGSTQLGSASVGATQILDASITAAKIGTGQVVKSVNGLTDALTLAAGSNISITPSGNTLTLASTGGSGPWSLNGTSTYYNNGNVGIGTSTPAASLDLFSSSGNPTLLKLKSPNGNGLFEATATRPTIAFRDQFTSLTNPPYSVIGGYSGGLRFYTDSFWTGGNAQGLMTLDSNGLLGIGTQTPLSPLHISGYSDALRLTGTHPYITIEDNGPSSYSRIQGNLNGIDLKTQGAATGSNPGGLIHLDGLGTVGLGTTTPSHQLTIVSNSGTPTWTSNGWLGAVALDNATAIAWQTNTAGQRFGMGHTNGSFAMFRTASNPGTTGSAATYDLVITDAGNVGVGTTGPLAKLGVVSGGDINNPQAQLTQTTSGDYARLRFSAVGSSSSWDISNGSAAGVLNFYALTTGKNVMSLNPNGTASVQVLSITGGSDLAEPFPMQDQVIENGAVVVIDEQNPGHLKRSMRAYDRRVAGIVSGANGIKPGISLHQDGALEGGQNVALSGRVYVAADTSNGPIEPGDLLTTSGTPGRAMKVTDHTRAQGAVLGKAMTPLSEGDGMVLTLVTLQ